MCKRKMGLMVVLLVVTSSATVVADDGDGDEVPDVWTVAVVADLNEEYGSKEYNHHVEAAVEWIASDLQPDLVLSAGDMVAGQREGLDYPGMWEAFHATVTDELAEAGIPMAVTPGNHDASEQPKYWKERVEFARQWQTRRPNLNFIDDSYFPFHYAFELGPALFLSLDGTGVGDLDDAQLAWIEDMLERNAHLEVSVLFSHVPQYPVAQGREDEVFEDARLAELMDEYGVDLMVSGHHHAYYPARRNGTYFLHAQVLGSGARALIGEEQSHPRNVAVVEFDADGVRDVRAFESPDFDEVVAPETLPETIGEDDVKLWRMDVESAGR